MDFSVTALLLAAGSGSRMGASGSKLLLKVNGESLIERSVRLVAAAKQVERIVVVVPSHERSIFEALNLGRISGGKPLDFVEGGKSRQESVRNGLAYLRRNLAHLDGVMVAVHDGARCMASPALIDRVIKAGFQHGAVTAAIQMIDSLKRVNSDGQVIESVSREGIWAVQTPQVFRFDWLWEAHHQEVSGASDDASLVERLYPVYMVEGERGNLKITTPEDLEFVRCWIDNHPEIPD